MTAIDTLDRAIAKLEAMRDRARPLPWDAYTVPDEPRKAGYVAIAADDQEIVVARYEGGYFDAELIVTLSCTVEPMLDTLRFARGLFGAQIHGEQAAATVDLALYLARAILGEDNDHDR